MGKSIVNSRTFLFLSFGIMLLSFVGIISNYLSQLTTLQHNAHTNVLKYDDNFEKYFQIQANHIQNILFLLEKREDLIKSFLASNREDLYSISKPIFEDFEKNGGLSHFYFIKPNDEIFLRVHMNQEYSDLVNRFTYKKAKESQKDFYGLEFGVKNTLAFRYVHPWIVDGKLIGYIELGKEIDQITTTIAKRMNLEVFHIINKKEFTNISSTNEKFIVYNTTDVNETISNFMNSEETTKFLSFNNKHYMAFKYQLSDVSGKNLGSKIMLVNVTDDYNKLTKFSIYYGLMMFGASLLVLFIGFEFLKKKQKRIDFIMNDLIESKNKFELLFNQQQNLLELFNIGDSVLFKWNNDEHSSVSYVSNNIENLLGYSKEDFLSNKIKYIDCVFKEDLEKFLKVINDKNSQKDGFFRHLPYRIVNKDGDILWVLDNTIFSKNINGEVTHFLSYIVNINEHKTIERNLKKLVDSQTNIIILTDGKELTYANKQFFIFFNKYLNLEDFRKEHECICEFFIEDDRYFHLERITKEQNWIVEIQKEPDGKNIVAMRDKHDITHSYSVHVNDFDKNLSVISFTDITETIIKQEALEKKVCTDKLTTAYNREFFDKNIELILDDNDKNSLKTVIVMFDIDHFKKVNDTFGHDVGDEVLKEFVEIIKSISRFNDILIRWGGEEFLMILSVKDENTLPKILEKYRETVANNNFKFIGKVTCSIGASVYDGSEMIKDTIKKADTALYEAKTSGRNRVSCFKNVNYLTEN